jgi:hypothetical protein
MPPDERDSSAPLDFERLKMLVVQLALVDLYAAKVVSGYRFALARGGMKRLQRTHSHCGFAIAPIAACAATGQARAAPASEAGIHPCVTA